MSNLKKVISSILLVVFMLCLVQVPTATRATENNIDKTYVKVRYKRADNNYDGWNIWSWDDNNVGHVEEFDGVDSKGAYKIISRSKSDGQLGLIVRTDTWDKCYDGDVYVDLSEGDKEVIFDQESRSYEVVEPQQEFDDVVVKLHYYRFDNKYDNWDVWAWKDNGAAYSFEKDEFGVVATINIGSLKKDENIGFIVRKSDWSDREQSNLNDGNRTVSKTCINADGQVDVYVVQGEKGDFFTIDEAELAKEPKIFSAKIDTLKTVSFKTSFEVTDTSTIQIIDKDGQVLEIEDVTMSSDNKNGVVTVKENMDFANNSYTLKVVGPTGNYIEGSVTLGKIFASDDFADMYTYDGELGALYKKDSTKFVVWAPTAKDVKLALYGTKGSKLENTAEKVIDMIAGENGTWYYEESGDLNGVYYNYIVDGTEATDPYAKAVGVNGQRGMVINLDETDPTGWEVEYRPELEDATDAVIYEMHIRDFTIGDDSGVSLEYKGKFKGVWQSGTTIPNTDIKTGIDHLKELGVNTVQLIPVFDHKSIDETNLSTPQFNWGYDPQNYNAVEGSYSTDPYNASIRITEFKELIQALHSAGIRVTMDVVYNHTGLTETSNLNQIVPNYYYRQTESGAFSNGSGCGNELASERAMVRKFIVDSVVYWAKEFHLDGFRFDLMALHDAETMRQVRLALDNINPKITIIGEGWTGGDSTLSSDEQSLKANMGKNFGDMQIAAFNDDIRDGIKGHVFTDTAPAFVNGGQGFEETIKFGIVASTPNDQIDTSKVANNSEAWAAQPYQTVNYASAHDNLTLHDKLKTTNPDASEEEIVAMNKISAAIVLTSQGIPFMLSGEEFARTKVNEDGSFNENSYNASDAVNEIGWTRKAEYSDLFNYYKGLIQLREKHKAFRMNSTEEIQENLKFLDVEDSNVVAYTLNGSAVNDYWNNIAVMFNSNKEAVDVNIPEGEWVVVVNGEKAGVEALAEVSGSKVTVPAQSSYVLVDKASFQANGGNTDIDEDTINPNIDDNNSTNSSTNNDKTNSNAEKTGDSNNTILLVIISLISLGAVGTVITIRKRKVN